jgi:hypothetical protein
MNPVLDIASQRRGHCVRHTCDTERLCHILAILEKSPVNSLTKKVSLEWNPACRRLFAVSAFPGLLICSSWVLGKGTCFHESIPVIPSSLTYGFETYPPRFRSMSNVAHVTGGFGHHTHRFIQVSGLAEPGFRRSCQRGLVGKCIRCTIS